MDIPTKKILHKYSARLMSCGAAVTSITAFDDDESTFIVLGGVEGSLCIRELNRRRKDNKLQCLLLRCFDKLVPERNDQVEIPEGCPVSSLSIATDDLCIVGDAACSVFVINMSLHQWRSATNASEAQGDEMDENDGGEEEGRDIQSREETREPSSEEKEEEAVVEPVEKEPVRQRSIELPIETRQLPKREESAEALISERGREDAEIDASIHPVTKTDESPKITVVSPKSHRTEKIEIHPSDETSPIDSHHGLSPKREPESPSNAQIDSHINEVPTTGLGADLSPNSAGSVSPRFVVSPSPEDAANESPKRSESVSQRSVRSPSPKDAANESPKSAENPSPRSVGSTSPKVVLDPTPKSAANPSPKSAGGPSPKSAGGPSPKSVAEVSPQSAPDSPRSRKSEASGSPKASPGQTSPKSAPQLEESFSEENLESPKSRKQSHL